MKYKIAILLMIGCSSAMEYKSRPAYRHRFGPASLDTNQFLYEMYVQVIYDEPSLDRCPKHYSSKTLRLARAVLAGAAMPWFNIYPLLRGDKVPDLDKSQFLAIERRRAELRRMFQCHLIDLAEKTRGKSLLKLMEYWEEDYDEEQLLSPYVARSKDDPLRDMQINMIKYLHLMELYRFSKGIFKRPANFSRSLSGYIACRNERYSFRDLQTKRYCFYSSQRNRSGSILC